jgi:DGQHR domain-containing protein
MFKVSWDRETGGVKLSALAGKDTINISPRPVFYEELNLLGLNTLGWQYPECKEPLLWACNKEYYYCGDLVFEAKNANIYDKATIVFQPGKEELKLKPVDMKKMLERTKEQMFLCESEAIEFIRDIYDTYSGANRMTEKHAANRIDFESLVERQEKKTKQKMAIVREDCESFDIMPLSEAEKQGKKVLKATKIDYFLASFSGGKDSQVVLDLCTRALPPDSFQVIYSDTGYELPSSIALYDEVQEYYHKQFPTLKFSTAKNHESVLNYWDKIGSPSDKHRWCCAVMKTAPLYRMLKLPNSNKQAIAERVNVDNKLYNSKSLSEQLQRALTDNHKSIKEYILTQKEHFFNALVLAVYDGEPTWNELDLEFQGNRYYSMGFLRLNGQENIFPVDGQHRVKGIMEALKENPKLKDEEIAVIFIGHHNTEKGKEKTRRIFSTLNRYAKPVTPGDNIALDEDDVVAITTRDLLEHCPLFMNENVNIGKKNSRALPDNDDKSFTSLITLYDTNRMIYTYYKSIRDHQKKVYNSTKIAGFLKFRPEQQDIDHFYNYLMDFWNMFINTFPGVKHYVDNCDDAKAASTYRNKEAGGLLYFRPIALPQLIKAIFETKFRTQLELNDCILKYAQIEMCISKEPWLNMLWDKEKQNMIMDYKTKICYMLIFLFSKEVLTQKEKNTLTKNFAEANHYDENMAKKKLHEMQSIV